MGNKAWKESELEYLKENYKEKTYKEMADFLDRSKTAVDLKVNRLGLKKEKHTYNHDYFNKIDTEDTAYWLGFIYADGCVCYRPEKSNTELAIKLSSVDDEHLRKFNKCIDGNCNITYATRECNLNGKMHESVALRVYSKRMVEDLMKHGITQNKTFTIEFPEIREDLIRHFIRGFFDGDGCVSNHNKKAKTIQIDFCSASLSFLKSLRATLYSFGVSSYIIDEKARNTYRLYVSGLNNCHKMVCFMYNNSNMYLDRKFNKTKRFYHEYNIEQRLLPHAEMCGFNDSEKENGKAEMPIRVEGYL